ncbi:heme o synthase [Pseudochelatococcus contaminans]|uniref:Protoheme IX farnesyltransferase n=1 Tax=Pseudochelatococcus contaminans TaxID=1538103 RepID=A0A7W5Z4D4_9HYPH|nr:heme o synthase [Pseudochelatococcus contaminans]MBB3809507.1 protoheme IX farnesyltransferase [Pseudochelatococcus contaminans]
MTAVTEEWAERERTAQAEAPPLVSTGSVRDFISLLKPRVMSLVVFTALVGMLVAPGAINPVVGAIALLSIAVGAGASGCLNMWWDADIDKVMTRTRNRPIPGGRITGAEALTFGLTLSFWAVFVLGVATNWFAAAFLAFTIFFYVGIYSIWLKRSTPQNIVIGGAAGAFPPMVGEAAVTGSVSIDGFVLFLIIFLWTPPHFWALALVKSEDYARAGVPMMPIVAGQASTRLQILLYTLVVVPVATIPLWRDAGGPLYAFASIAGGAGMLWLAFTLWRSGGDRVALNPYGVRTAWRLFGFSIMYLFALFAALLVEHVTGLGPIGNFLPARGLW